MALEESDRAHKAEAKLRGAEITELRRTEEAQQEQIQSLTRRAQKVCEWCQGLETRRAVAPH